MPIQFDALTHGFGYRCQSSDERVDRGSKWRFAVGCDGDSASLAGNAVCADTRVLMCLEGEGRKGAYPPASGGDQGLDGDVVVGLELDPRIESSSIASGEEVGSAARATGNPGLTGVVRDLVGGICIPRRGDQVQRIFQQSRLRDMLEPDFRGCPRARRQQLRRHRCYEAVQVLWVVLHQRG